MLDFIQDQVLGMQWFNLLIGEFYITLGKEYLTTQFAFLDVCSLHVELVAEHFLEVCLHLLASNIFDDDLTKIHFLHSSLLYKR